MPIALSAHPGFDAAWLALLEARKRANIPSSEYAAKLQLRKLAEIALRRGPDVALEAVELATAGGKGLPWQGIFEPEERKGSPARASAIPPATGATQFEVAKRQLTAAIFKSKSLDPKMRDELLEQIKNATTVDDLGRVNRWV